MINLSLIAAFDDNRGVGIENKLPWYFPEDLKHFKNITMGKNMIMGKKTYDSLPGILPGRKHIVLTTDVSIKSNNENVIFVNSLNDCLSLIEKLENKNNIVIGGGNIWNLFLPYINKFYITHIFGSYQVDTYFPEQIDFSKMTKISSKMTENCEYIEYTI
jgi:dihydrofolate reductase